CPKLRPLLCGVNARLPEEQRELLPERDRRLAGVAGELGEGVVPVPVVRDERTAFAERRPRGAELEVDALVRVLAVVHEEVDRPEPLEEGRELLLAPADGEVPPLLQLGRDHPPGLLPGRDRRSLLALPEGS